MLRVMIYLCTVTILFPHPVAIAKIDDKMRSELIWFLSESIKKAEAYVVIFIEFRLKLREARDVFFFLLLKCSVQLFKFISI